MGATNQSLKSIGRCFEDRLNRSLLSSSNSLLRHIRSRKDDNLRRNMHQCPGYLREEITLTCDVSKSVIVSHVFPGESELCSICHQLVQHTYSEPDYNYITPDDPFLRSRAPSPSSAWSPEAALSFDNFAPIGSIDPFPCFLPLGDPFQPLSFDDESIQSTVDPNIAQDISLPGIFGLIFIHIHVIELTPF